MDQTADYHRTRRSIDVASSHEMCELFLAKLFDHLFGMLTVGSAHDMDPEDQRLGDIVRPSAIGESPLASLHVRVVDVRYLFEVLEELLEQCSDGPLRAELKWFSKPLRVSAVRRKYGCSLPRSRRSNLVAILISSLGLCGGTLSFRTSYRACSPTSTHSRTTITSHLVMLVIHYRVGYAKYLPSQQGKTVGVPPLRTRMVAHGEIERGPRVFRDAGGGERLPRHSWRYAPAQLPTGRSVVGTVVDVRPFSTPLYQEPQKTACVQLCVVPQGWVVVVGAYAGDRRHARQRRRGYIFSCSWTPP